MLLLPLWTELLAVFRGIHIKQDFTCIETDQGVLELPNGSEEAKHVQKVLGGSHVDKRIGVLRTDLADKPLFIRVIKD